MSTTSGITSTPTIEPTQQSAAGRFGELSSEEFIEVLITEMTNQDPFNPNDSAKVLEQMSSLRNIESQLSLQTSIESLVTQNNIAQAGSLLQRTVEGLDDSNNTIKGQVTAVRVVNGKAVLEIDGISSLKMDRVTAIQ